MSLKSQMCDKSWGNLKKLRGIVGVMGLFLGLTEGLYLFTWGPYLYEKFGGDAEHLEAMLLLTVLQITFCVTTIFLEVPTGALADAIGRAHTVMLSWIFRFCFFACLGALCVVSSIPLTFCLAMLGVMCLAIGYTLFNGAFVAWKADWMKENLEEVNLTWASSLFQGCRAGAVVVGVSTSIFCYTHSFAYLSYIIALFVTFCALVFSSTKMEEVKRLNFLNSKKVTMANLFQRVGENFGKGMNAAFKTPVLFWTLMTYGAYMFLLNIVLYLWPVYLNSEWGAEHFTWQWMALAIIPNLCGILGSQWLAKKSHSWLGKQKKSVLPLKNIFISLSITSSIAIISLSICTALHLTTYAILFTAVFIVAFSMSLIIATFEALINHFIPEELAQQRSTVMSGGSMIRGMLMAIFIVPAGGTGGQTTPIFWSFPAVLLLISAITTAIIITKHQKKSITAEKSENKTDSALLTTPEKEGI